MNNYVELNSITIPPNRQRRKFDEGDLRTLIESIERNGLLHAPVVRLLGDSYTLVAGERRLRAIRDIYDMGGHFSYAGAPVVSGMVPVVSVGELSANDALEAELEENIRRTDLTWQEKAAASANLLKLRELQASAKGESPPSVADIAEEIRSSRLGKDQNETKKEIILARYLHDPEVAAAKTSDEAFKLLIRKEQSRKNAELSEVIGRTFTLKEHRLVQADCMEWLARCASNTFDVILTDPPYGMGADEFGDSGQPGTIGAHGYEDTVERVHGLIEDIATDLFRVAKKEAHLYLFCDIEQFFWLRSVMTERGWRCFRTPLIWHKPGAFRAPWPEHGPQRKYECILYAVKGDKKVNRLAPDVLTYPPDANIGHAAQKPITLFHDLLARSCVAGDSVLDPFCGTGTIFPAAHALKLKATGVEVDASFHGIAAQRIQRLA